MKNILSRYWSWMFTLLVGIGIWAFWAVAYPHALSYQEQNQLFLTTMDFFVERISIAGGLADYIGEFITQFNYIPWLGALLVTVVYLTALLGVAGKGSVDQENKSDKHESANLLLKFIPVPVLLYVYNDENVLLSYAVAMALTMLTLRLTRKMHWAGDIILVPALYWLVGPMAWIYVIVRTVSDWKRSGWTILYLLGTILVLSATVLQQWPQEDVMRGIGYYRIQMMTPAALPAGILIVALCQALLSRSIPILDGQKYKLATNIISCVAFIGLCAAAASSYDKDVYALLRQDYLVRNERWDDIINEAKEHTVQTPFWSENVNLALAMKRQLAERQFEFWQSGEDALLMHMVRDNTSNLPTAEAFYRLGMVNSAVRYFSDLQESILNYRKSGRFTQRIAQCHIINGKYDVARKHLSLLKKSIFYRKWAEQTEELLGNEGRINTHYEYGRMRSLRYKDDFLYNYPEMEKMLGLLFINNSENKMALDYMMAQLLLKGKFQDFQQYMGWVQQYGGYSYMPVGYQDAMRCIQSKGETPGLYSTYVKRMMQTKHEQQSELGNEAH